MVHRYPTINEIILTTASVWEANQTINDNFLLRLGTDGDSVFKLTSAVVAADAEPDANVYVGTSDHQGTAANSLVISNITASGDIQILTNLGGNSLEALLIDSSAGQITLGWGGFDTLIADGRGLVIGHTAQLTAAAIVSETQIIGGDYADGSLGILLYSATANRGAIFNIGHGKNATIGTNTTAMASGDALAFIQFLGSDTASLAVAASIEVYADAAWSGATDRPTRMVFRTTPDGSGTLTDRLWITNGGVLTTLVAAPANVTALGAGIFRGGLAMTDVLNAMIDDASNGTGTVTHYIGNAAILTGNGVSFGPAAVASITVVNGQITAIS